MYYIDFLNTTYVKMNAQGELFYQKQGFFNRDGQWFRFGVREAEQI